MAAVELLGAVVKWESGAVKLEATLSSHEVLLSRLLEVTWKRFQVAGRRRRWTWCGWRVLDLLKARRMLSI
jgi:hypothetical protein